jgi:hypothetical protein
MSACLSARATRAVAAACALLSVPAWAGVPQLAGFEAVRIWEITYYTQSVDIVAGDSRLTEILAGSQLNGTQRDFGFFPGDENYDVYFSDANGVFDPNGTHITVDGNCFVPYNCFNSNCIAARRAYRPPRATSSAWVPARCRRCARRPAPRCGRPSAPWPGGGR